MNNATCFVNAFVSTEVVKYFRSLDVQLTNASIYASLLMYLQADDGQDHSHARLAKVNC
jgi:hypothetical protein